MEKVDRFFGSDVPKPFASKDPDLGIDAVPSGEVVVLTSKRTLWVKSHRIDGDNVILTLRSGGEVTADKSLSEKIVPHEVPNAELKARELAPVAHRPGLCHAEALPRGLPRGF